MKKHHLFLAVAAAFTLIQTAAVTVFAAVLPSVHDVSRMLRHSDGTVFPIGSYNARNVDHFTGDSYVAPLSKGPVPVANVTFVRGAHTHWHVHHGTSQTLLAVSGQGYYQIDGQPPRQLLPGQNVTIPTGAGTGMARHRVRCSSILPSWNRSRGPGPSGSKPLMIQHLKHCPGLASGAEIGNNYMHMHGIY